MKYARSVHRILKEFNVVVEVSGNEVARYYPKQNKIVLPTWWDSAIFMLFKNVAGRACNTPYATLYHECGHALDMNLGLSRRAEYKRLFGDAKAPYYGISKSNLGLFKRPRAGYVSKYAESHAIEDFADTFAAYAMKLSFPNDPVIQQKLAFVRKVLREL
jgi:hypothetical protein